jgi:peptidyl-tRNA hydrolase, PTH1 family
MGLRSRLRGGSAGGPVDWMIIGLGNPEPGYEYTPHNVGFAVARRLIERWDLAAPKTRYRGLVTQGRTMPGGPSVAVLMPQTYMNDSGLSAGPARGALKVPLDHVIAVYDEIDLPFGEIRAKLGGGTAGHNGMKSLKAGLGSTDFQRVRVGVGRPNTTDPEIVAAHVLGKWRQSKAEVETLVDDAVRTVAGIVEAVPEPE